MLREWNRQVTGLLERQVIGSIREDKRGPEVLYVADASVGCGHVREGRAGSALVVPAATLGQVMTIAEAGRAPGASALTLALKRRSDDSDPNLGRTTPCAQGILTPTPLSETGCYVFAPLPFSASAFWTLCGAMGSSLRRTPTASKMALATVAGGGTMGTSPTPRTP